VFVNFWFGEFFEGDSIDSNLTRIVESRGDIQMCILYKLTLI
jgi:hypothetical protein